MVEKQRLLAVAHRLLSRSRRRRALAGVAALLAGVGAGVFWLFRDVAAGRPSAPPPPPVRITAAAEPAARAPAPARAPRPPPDIDAEEARKLEAFLAFITGELGFGRERQALLREALEEAPPRIVEALLRACFGDDEFNDIAHVLLERLAELAPEAALAFGHEKGFGLDPPWWHSVIGGLADPRAATEAVLSLPASEARTGYLGHIAFRLGLADPAAAAAHVAAGAPPEARSVVLANAAIGVGRRDPAAGLAFAIDRGAATEDPGLVRSLAVDWAMDDLAAARRHILAMPHGPARRAALDGLHAAAQGRGNPDN